MSDTDDTWVGEPTAPVDARDVPVDELVDEPADEPVDEPGDEPGDGIDFALAAYREEGVWQVAPLVHDVLGDVDGLVHALRRFPGDGGAVGLVGVDEDFFLIVRVAGTTTRLLLSDVTAADEWELAASAVDALGLPEPEDDDDQVPAGDLDLLADLGMGAIDMGVLLDDLDLYPDEMLSDVARRLGFGEQFDEAVGLASA